METTDRTITGETQEDHSKAALYTQRSKRNGPNNNC